MNIEVLLDTDMPTLAMRMVWWEGYNDYGLNKNNPYESKENRLVSSREFWWEGYILDKNTLPKIYECFAAYEHGRYWAETIAIAEFYR